MTATALLDERPRLLVAILVALFVLGVGVRLHKLDAPGVLLDRDFTSAIFARDYYLQSRPGTEAWRRDIVRATRLNQPTLEPPVTEWLAAQLYRIAGNEDLRLARLLTIAFMVAGGWFLYRITQRLVSTDAAVFALALYLFLPLSILLSRSFQADALMVLLYLASLWQLVRYHEAPAPRRLLAAAALTSATLLYRPLVMFPLLAAFVVPAIARQGLRRGLFAPPTLAFVALAMLPALAYYGYLTFVARNFGWKLNSSFRFDLFTHREYWKGWYDLAVLAVGIPALVMAFVGSVLLRKGLARSVVAALTLGYVAFGLLFTMHIHTHGYYHAQLIPLVAIAASPMAALVGRAFAEAPGRRGLKLVAAGALAFLVAVPVVREVRAGLSYSKEESPPVARAIGELVGHSRRVVFLSRYYGMPLQYYGEFTGSYWPRPLTYYLYRRNEPELSIAQRLAAIGFEPEYFVITAFDEFERHHRDLGRYLEERCQLKARAEAYLVYEACTSPDAPNPTRR